MDDLAVRRNRGITPPRYQAVEKAEKTPSGGGKPVGKASVSLSDTLRNLMTSASQLESQARAGRRTLRTGEAALAEVRESLDRIAELLEKAGEKPEGLEGKLEQLREQIDRVISSAAEGGVRLFLDEDAGTADEALLYAALGESTSGGVETLPDFLLRGIADKSFTPEELLTALGLDKTAGGSEILAAAAKSLLGNESAGGYLASLYLGAVISGEMDPEKALDGLRQLLDKVGEGVSPDEAIALLTNGTFSSISDFQTQFVDGTAPNLEPFLMDLLLSGDVLLAADGASVLSLLSGEGGLDLDLTLTLLSALDNAGTDLMDVLNQAAESQESAAGIAVTAETAGSAGSAETADTVGTAETAMTTETVSASVGELPEQPAQFGDIQVTSQDLSGVSESSGEVTLSGTEDAAIQGTAKTIVVTGSGTVTLQGVKAEALVIASPEARVFSAGENVFGEIRLESGVRLTLGGSGLLRLSGFSGGASNLLRLTGGAVTLLREDGRTYGTLAVPVQMEGPASLAADASVVRNAEGETLTAFDNLWKALAPEWREINSVMIDGRHVKLHLTGGDSPEAARFWLPKEDGSRGAPAHLIRLQGRDKMDRPKVHYAYLRWSRNGEAFEEITMYPNPFRVTGGEEGRDWIYDEESHELRILTDQVTAISGGAGVSAAREDFSGRLALNDGIGELTLTLDGVACRVESGRAFDLGSGNQVRLILRNGTENHFQSGEGFAGITLGGGTSLWVERGEEERGAPLGTLTAAGKGGGAGIGRDGGGPRDQTSAITILGGTVSASGDGGGAGIGAGKHSPIGAVAIEGGTVSAAGGKGGGAGIGGGLNGPSGDIRIVGGKVTASAVFHAAAIGAGIQGACGDILIAGTARIVKAVGGNPGADIGGCLFGGCGKVEVSGAADIGRAKLSTHKGVTLQVGKETVTLPQFRLSSKALRLDTVNTDTREAIQAAKRVIENDKRWIAQIQTAYSALYNRLEQNSVPEPHERAYQRRLRDNGEAGAVLADTRQSLPGTGGRTHGRQNTADIGRLLG